MEELYNKLKGLDKNTLQVLILLLMEERIIEYSDITEVYMFSTCSLCIKVVPMPITACKRRL